MQVGVSKLGSTEIHFIEPDVKVNGAYYRHNLLAQKLLPGLFRLSQGGFFIFQQDGAPAHRARDTVAFLEQRVPDFIPRTLWPPNSPDLNPLDYTIASGVYCRRKFTDPELLTSTNLKRVLSTSAWARFDYSGAVVSALVSV